MVKKDTNGASSLIKHFFFFKDDIKILVESAKNATSASNSTVSNMTERLRNISQEVDKTEIRNWKPDILSDADQTGECVLYL